MYEHNLNPIAFSFFGLKIYWYSLAYIFGFLFTYWYSKKLIRNKMLNLDLEIAEDFISIGILAVILGGRFGYVFFYNFEYYLVNPIEIFKIWKGGMSFHGALIGLVCHLVIFSHKNKQDIIELANLLAFSGPVGIFLGRISNFLNKELIGKPTEFFLSVRYPNEDFYRHISQIYEAIFEGLIPAILLLLFYYKFKVKNGIITSFFLINYGLSRIIIENFRMPDIQVGLKFNLLSQGQLLSIPIVILGFYFLYLCQYKQR